MNNATTSGKPPGHVDAVLNSGAAGAAGAGDAGDAAGAAGDAAAVFSFERDFAGTLRCIPMAVRFKLDLCGIKLSLRQWNRFDIAERQLLLRQCCDHPAAVESYRARVTALINARTGEAAQLIPIDAAPPWNECAQVPQVLQQYAAQLGIAAPGVAQWAALTPLQRFTLLKLTRASHDNVNFLPALREFGL